LAVGGERAVTRGIKRPRGARGVREVGYDSLSRSEESRINSRRKKITREILSAPQKKTTKEEEEERFCYRRGERDLM